MPNVSYRSLERLCRIQASLASTKQIREVLEEMAAEYRKMACWLECQGSEPNQPHNSETNEPKETG
jgi:hypothetical protein